jgi:hypothetical protein
MAESRASSTIARHRPRVASIALGFFWEISCPWRQEHAQASARAVPVR